MAYYGGYGGYGGPPRYHPYAGGAPAAPMYRRPHRNTQPRLKPMRPPLQPPMPTVPVIPVNVLPPDATTGGDAAALAPAIAAAPKQNYKGDLNIWLQKHGHNLGIAYSTGPAPGGQGFMSSLVLPIEGAGGLEHCSGTGSTKKDAESMAAKSALEALDILGLLNAPTTLPPSKSKLRRYGKSAYDVEGTSNAPSSMMSKMLMPASAPPPAPPAPVSREENDANFEALKQLLLEKVVETPGKRARAYLQMFPVEEQRKRIQAALYALEKEGQLAKTVPTTGTDLAPFWHPVDYAGPLGGNIDESQLGEGRSFPLQDVKAVIFEVLMQTPHLNCMDIKAQCATRGCDQERKVIQACLYQMEKEGHAKKTLCMTPGPGPKWPTWEVVA